MHRAPLSSRSAEPNSPGLGNTVDIAIVGGGPAGLSAAVAAGRMNRSVLCFEAGTPRTAHAPRYFNYLGFPQGITGRELLRLGREQAARWGGHVHDTEVLSIERLDEGRQDQVRFRVQTSADVTLARGVILATGIVDRQPSCGSLYGRRGVHYCVVCDGYETRGQRVAVIGHDRSAFELLEALRDFTPDLHLLLDGRPLQLDEDQQRLLTVWGVLVHHASLRGYQCSNEGVWFRLDADERFFPHVFVALGPRPNTVLAVAIGCRLDTRGFIATDAGQATSVPFVYAAGDCDGGHKQVTQAMAEGQLAAIELARALRRAANT
jgi:thioredoxin reductase (NADPH)